jgi:hypothetical protein
MVILYRILQFSTLYIHTGDSITITGNITGLSNCKTQGHLIIYSNPGPNGRFEIISRKPDRKYDTPA